jgi:recombination protein RecA
MGRKTAAATAARLTTPVPRTPPIPASDFVSFGVTTLNLAVAGRTSGGLPKGKYLYFVGDSSSGKTWFSLGVAAELARNKHFDDYRIIYDASENGALMDIPAYFGDRLAGRLEPPRGTRDNPQYSRMVEEMYYNLDAALDEGPCLYIEDSFDALLAEADDEKFGEARSAFEKTLEDGKERDLSGSYGTAKAKTHSNNINRVVQRLQETGSILVGVSQTRDKIGGMGYGPQKTRAGGKALRFYAHVEIWTSVRGPIKVTKLGKEREVGNLLQLDVQKNRITGWEGKIEVPFLRKLGLDDLGCCVDFLVGEKHWKKADKGSKITAPEFRFEGTRDALLAKIEGEDAERELQLLVGDVWRKIEEACLPGRKPRYG